MRRKPARGFNRRRDAARCPDMVVLDQYAVGKVKAVV
jgi:hypothetical protein